MASTGTGEVLVLIGPGPKLRDVKLLNGSDELKKLDKTLAATFPPFPDDGPTRIVRRAYVGCYPSSGCSMVLMPPDSVTSLQWAK